MSKKKSKKMDKAVVVALIGLTGTVIAALLASPFFDRLFSEPSVPPATEGTEADFDRVFWEDFEKGYPSGLSISSEEWQVMEDGEDSVLEVSGIPDGNTLIGFGPTDFSDGRIEFELYFKNCLKGKRKPSGRIPTTARGTPSTSTVRPRAAGSPP